MYGLINQAIKKMYLEHKSHDDWSSLCKSLKLQNEDFSTFESYGDDITLNLVLHISKELDLEPAVLLESFGIYWVNYAQQSEYQSIFETFATSPVALIKSLDSLHTRLELIFDNLQAPSFSTEEVNDNEVLVYYSSKRDLPLEPFVCGLIKGIFGIFDKECKVEIINNRSDEKDACLRVNF